ncbi:hypothetical protein CHU98_g1267 [Xylaria longipes]|nr:hypothetical protein CHU98_g1267 [Xylaria longipes]
MSVTMWSDDLAQSRQPFAVPDTDSGDEAEETTSPQAQRKRVNRMLRLLKRKAIFYELLDVKANATEKDIYIAWKKTIYGLYPDKNKDRSAQECTQAANAAKDVLVDPRKRQIYDNFIKTNPPPPETETFDEHFAHGAFDEDSSDNAIEEDGEENGENSEEDDEKHYPPPDKQDVEGSINFSLLDAVDKINKQIEKENYNRQRPVIMELSGSRIAEQMLIGADDITALQDTDKNEDVDMDDIEMEDVSTEFSTEDIETEDGDEEAEDVYHQNTNTGRQIQPLRPGFTSLGDPILGYFPIQRRSKAMGETIILGFKVFVKVDDINPIRIMENAAKYPTMAPTDFVDIIGVTWIPGSSSPGRLLITYVWAKALVVGSKKLNIMTRTTFRQWIGTSLADKHINFWLFNKGIIPEWTASGFPTDPTTDSKSLRLTYPLKRRAQTRGVQPPTVPSGEDDRVKELGRKFDQLVDLFTRGQEEAREDRRQQREIMRHLLPARQEE